MRALDHLRDSPESVNLHVAWRRLICGVTAYCKGAIRGMSL